MVQPRPARREPVYHCCDYCDRFHREPMAIVNAADNVIGYACQYCAMVHHESITRRKAEHGPPTPWAH
jgi:hypothetical protein